MNRWLLCAASALALALSGCDGCGSDPHHEDAGVDLQLSTDLSTVEVTPDQVPADGTAVVTIKVTVRSVTSDGMAGLPVSLTVSGEGNTLSAMPQQTDEAGVASFTLRSTRAQTKTVTARVGEVELLQRPTVVFAPGAASKLSFRVQPSSAQAGQPIVPAVVVDVVDESGNRVPGATHTVALGLDGAPEGGTLGGNAQVAAVAGSATFAGLSVAEAGQGYFLIASAAGLAGASSATFNITSGLPEKLAFRVQPTNAQAGVQLTPALEIELQDAAGNQVSSTEPVTLSIATGPVGATLLGTTSATPAEGVATFADLLLNRAGTYTLAATASGFAGATSSSFTISPTAAAAIAFTDPPNDVGVRQAFSVSVAIRDAQGNLVPGAGGELTLSLSGTGSGQLLGATTTQASGGVATFSGLSVDDEGTGYTLQVSGEGLPPTASSSFTVTDNLAPAAVGNLSVSSAAQTSLTLSWSAVGDDGMLGMAASHQLRRSTQVVTEANFASATEIPLGAPVAPGVAETATASGLSPGTTYHFGLRVSDGAGNSSFAVASGTTSLCAVGYEGPACEQCAAGYRVTSPGVCQDYCTNPDPCNPPPANSCSGNVALSYPSTLSCSPTTTSPFYQCQSPVQTDCGTTGKLCHLGTCQTDPCLPNPCSPPAAECDANGQVVSYNQGACTVDSGGSNLSFSCQFSPIVTVCTTGTACLEGACALVQVPLPGELLITEVMYAPVISPTAQWFEVYNLSSKLLDLGGMTVEAVGGQSFTVPSSPPMLLEPGAYFVFGHSGDPAQNGGAVVNLAYGALNAAFVLDGTSALRLSAGGSTVEELNYGQVAPGAPAGTSVNLSSAVLAKGANQYAWYWCQSVASMSGSGKGTPGAANHDCAIAVTPPVNWCRLQYPITAGTVGPTDLVTVYARFFHPGVTDRNQSGNDHYPLVVAELGHGAQPLAGLPDVSTWSWVTAGFNAGWGVGSPSFSGNNDEVSASLSITGSGGYLFGYRFRLLDPVTGAASPNVYCDRNGVVPSPENGQYGTITVVDPSGDLAAARAAPDGSGLSLAVEGAYVTYLKPAVGSDLPGFFLQAEQAGPALFVAVEPSTLTPAPAVGDLVRLTITQMGTIGTLRQALAVSGFQVVSGGHPVAPLSQEVSNAPDLISNLVDYESELVGVTGTLATAFASAGAGFVSVQLETAAVPSNTNLRLRVPITLRDGLELVQGCVVKVNETPMWRYNAQAQVSGWVAQDLTVQSCPAPKVLNAVPTALDEVVVNFDRILDPASISASGNQFAITPGLAVSAAVVSGLRQVTLSTAVQTTGTLYTVTVAPTVTDQHGIAVAPGGNTAVFSGFSATCQPSQVVISQVYGGGGNSGATYTHDFIELHNRSTQAVSIGGWSVQYTSTSGTGWTNKTDIPVGTTLQPGQYFLIQQFGGTVGVALPAADLTGGTINIAGSNGKVALVSDTTVLSGGCPLGGPVVDFVGFGTADCKEGLAAAPAPSATNSVQRALNGCQDTDENGADFSAAPVAPRNTASAAINCGCN